MRFLKTNTATRVTVGPFLDKTDGITPETAITVTGCHLTLMVDTAGVPTLSLDADATASGGNNDMVHVTGDDAGFYDLELTAAQLNYVGRAMLSINDVATHCPVFHEFMILPAMIYDSLVAGSDRLDTNVTHIGDTSQTGRDIGASVLISSGTGTGQLDVTSGVVKANLAQILGTALTETSGYIAAAFKQFFNVASPTGTMKAITNVVTTTTATNLTNAPTAGDLTATMKTSVTTAATAATPNLNAAYNAAKTAAQAGDAMALTSGERTTLAGVIWNSLTSGLTTASSIGKLLVDNVNATISSRSSHAAADVWSVTTRLLSAGTNIVLAKGTGVTGFNDLSAAQVNAEADTALADYDAPTKAELDSGLAGLNDPTAAAVADAVWDEAKSGHTTAGTFGKSVADVEADTNELQADDYPTSIAAVKSDTAAILIDTAVIGAAGAGLTAIPWNAAWDAEVQSEATDALNAYDPPTKTEMDSGFSGLNDPTVAEIADAVWDEATSGHSTAGTTGKALTDAGGAGTPPSAADVADAVWDELLSGHTTTGSAGDTLGNVATGTPPSAAAIRAEIDSNSTQLAAIVADTNELQGEWANGGRLDNILDARASQTSVDDLPTNSELATALGTADDAVLSAIAALNNLSSAQAQTAAAAALTAYDGPTHAEMTAELATADDAVLVAINALNNLSQANVRTAVGLGSANLDTQLSTIAGYIDTEIAAIKAKTDNIPASPAAVGDIPTAVENADALLGRNIAGGSSTGRVVTEALQALRNKVALVSGTATVFSEDDSTPSWTAAVTTDAAADPIITVDPA